MKQIGGLFALIGTRENLAKAFWRAAKGKRNRPEVKKFELNFNLELSEISSRIRQGTWQFSPYREFTLNDPKTRTIRAPIFRDRVVHHAIINVVGSVFEKGALFHSYACRTGRGQHAALRQARDWTRRRDWYGKMDVEKFYDSVDHAILFRLLARRFRENRLLNLFENLIASYQTAPRKGLPIGALTSQYLGNFYLDEFDRNMKQTGLVPRYLRYMDDTLVWGNCESVTKVRDCARGALADLGLILKHDGEWNRTSRGIPFLGFVIYPDRIRLNAQGKRRLRRKFNKVEADWHQGTIDDETRQARAGSLFAHALTADDGNWRRMVIRLSADRFANEFGDAPESQPRHSRRLLEQLCEELPFSAAQQERSVESQQEPGFPGLFGSRHGGSRQPVVAHSRSLSFPDGNGDKSTDKPPVGLDICTGPLCHIPAKKRSTGAPQPDDLIQ